MLTFCFFIADVTQFEDIHPKLLIKLVDQICALRAGFLNRGHTCLIVPEFSTINRQTHVIIAVMIQSQDNGNHKMMTFVPSIFTNLLEYQQI